MIARRVKAEAPACEGISVLTGYPVSLGTGQIHSMIAFDLENRNPVSSLPRLFVRAKKRRQQEVADGSG
jgi:hypothetical protein